MWTTTKYLLTHNAFYSVQCRQLWWSHLIRWPVSSSSYNSTFSLVACHLLCWIRVIFLVKLISESGESSLLWMNKFPLRNCTIARMRWRVWSNEEPWDRGYVWYVWYVWYDAATRDVSVTEYSGSSSSFISSSSHKFTIPKSYFYVDVKTRKNTINRTNTKKKVAKMKTCCIFQPKLQKKKKLIYFC